MTEASKIEWTDHTFSPWLGCTPVSAACDNCYASALSARYGWPVYRKAVPRRRTTPSTWREPHRWQRKAAANGVRASVFPSLCDPFDGEVPIDWIDQFVDEQVLPTPDLDWLLLTKRPQLARKYFAGRQARGKGGVPDNVCLGTTVETQPLAAPRLKHLAAIEGAKLRFVSVEPMLGPIDLRPWLESGVLDWVIAGGESGRRARPTQADWIRALRDQCVAAGVAFFLKQWGEWAPRAIGQRVLKPSDPPCLVDGEMYLVGKVRAGAELDGRHWRQLPPQLQRPA